MMSQNIHEQLEKVNQAFNHGPNTTSSHNSQYIKSLEFETVQSITYGAPGTGKSHKTKGETDKWKDNVFRTTFHPDSDYSTFVGAYKPSMSDDAGLVKVYKGETDVVDATQVVQKGISYEFIPQAFIKAYVLAWKKMNDAPNGEDGNPNPEPVFLVIEEINRGNCAQIFGDIFQLLDRNEAGYSEYPIDADEDLRKFLSRPDDKGGLGGLDADAISTKFGVDKKEVELIRDGKHLMLPPNLLIRATMNTSDQSLFPIDSAFKRRWDWKYVPITEGKDKNGQPMKWKIKFTVPAHYVGEHQVAAKDYVYDWWEFLRCVNTLIFKTTDSEDKKLGYFFVKPDGKSDPNAEDNDLISADRFVGKVIFYLWNDVFKDYGIETIFKVAAADKKSEDEARGVEFQAFFNEDDDHANVNTLLAFFKHLELKSDEEKTEAANAQNNQGAAQDNPPAQDGNANLGA